MKHPFLESQGFDRPSGTAKLLLKGERCKRIAMAPKSGSSQ